MVAYISQILSQCSPSLCDIESSKPLRQMRRLRLKILTTLPKGVHPSRSWANTRTKTPDSQSNAFVFWLACFPSENRPWNKTSVFSLRFFFLNCVSLTFLLSRHESRCNASMSLSGPKSEPPLPSSCHFRTLLTTWVNLHPHPLVIGRKEIPQSCCLLCSSKNGNSSLLIS